MPRGLNIEWSAHEKLGDVYCIKTEFGVAEFAIDVYAPAFFD